MSERVKGVVGITGGIGAGKSALANMLSDIRAWPLLEADGIGHEALRPGSGVLPALVARFGEELLAPDGSIDRGRLGAIVFASPGDLADLNRIVHPYILERLHEEVAALRRGGWADIILVDAALLLDWLEHFRPQWIVLVRSPRRLRFRRLESRGLSRAQAERRIDCQRPMETVPEADWIIDNDGDLSKLRAGALKLAGLLEAAGRDGAGSNPPAG